MDIHTKTNKVPSEVKSKNSCFPLGLPQGSVRALITMIALGVYFLASLYAMYSGKPVPEGLTNIAITVTAFYFGTRGGEKEMMKEIQNETIIEGNVRDFENIEAKDQTKYQKVGSVAG